MSRFPQSGKSRSKIKGGNEKPERWIMVARYDRAEAEAQADMIFCSVSDRPELPPLGNAWIHLWLPQKRKIESALVALIRRDSGANAATPAEKYLRWVSKSAGMGFFVKEFAARNTRLPSTSVPAEKSCARHIRRARLSTPAARRTACRTRGRRRPSPGQAHLARG